MRPTTATRPAGLDRDLLASLPIDVSADELEALLRRWRVAELAVFGSVLRDDFGPDSDIDLLVRFEPDQHVGLFAFDELEAQLTRAMHRDVELVSRRGAERSRNERRHRILSQARTLYAAS